MKQSPTELAPEETITLSPFEVTTDKDDGFAANSAGMGGRLKMNMEDIAAPYSAMTREFIDALNVTNLVEAGSWSTNAGPVFDGQGVDMFGNPNLVNVRGVGASQGGQRNFSFTASVLDSYNLERYEFGRGPNGALFNIVSGSNDNPLLGGQSATTKKARLDRSFTTASYGIGSWNYNRATLDVNQPLTDKIAIRSNMLWYDRDGWRLNEFEKTKGLTLAGTYLLSPKSEFRIEGSAEALTRSQPMTLVMDKLSGWDGKTVFNAPITDAVLAGTTVNPATGQALTNSGSNQGVDRRGGLAFVYVPGFGQIMNYQGEALTRRGDENANVPIYTGGTAVYRGTGLPFGNSGNNSGSPASTLNGGDELWFLGQNNLPADRFDRAISNSNFRIPSRRFTYLPDFPVFEQHTKDLNAAFTHQFAKNLVAEVGFDINSTHDARMQNANQPRITRIDINQNLPDGTPNPYYLQPYGDMAGRLNNRTTDVAMARFNLGWYKDLKGWGTYHVTLSALTNHITIEDRDYILSMANLGDARVWNSLPVIYRYYWNNPARPYNSPGDLPTSLKMNTFATGNTIANTSVTQVQPRWVRNGWADTTRVNSSISVPISASYNVFSKKMIFLLAPRYDTYRSSVKVNPNYADLPTNWDGESLVFKPDAPADWLGLTYIPKNTTTGAPLTAQARPAAARPRSNVAAVSTSNTTINLAQPQAVYVSDRFRDDFNPPDNTGHAYSGSYGVVYHVLPWLSAAGNYATNYSIPPTNTFTINNTQVEAREGWGADGSLRFHFFGSKLTANINYFYNVANRERVGSPIVGSANSLIQQQTATDAFTDGRNARGITDFFTNDYQSRWNKGVEIEITGKITPGWRIMVNAGSTKSAAFDQYELSQSWIHEWDPDLQLVLQDAGGMLTGGTQATGAPGLAVANPAVTPASTTDRNNAVSAYNNMWLAYANSVQLLARQNTTTGYKFNIYTDYTVLTGKFKGLRFGLGAQYRGGDRANVAGNAAGQTTVNAAGQVVDDPSVDQYDNVWVYQPTNTVATIGYKTKLLKRDVDFQLSIRNVLNEQAVIYQDNGVTLRPPGGDLTIPYRVATASRVADYQQPISFIFTTKLNF